MRLRFLTSFVHGRVLVGCLLALFLPACTAYHTNIKGESPNSGKQSAIQLHSPRAPAVIVGSKATGNLAQKQGDDMEKEALDRTIEQFRESGLFSDVWTHSEGGLSPEAVTLSITFDRQWDLHSGANVLKAVVTGLLLALPAPFVEYHYDLTGQMTLDATNGEGESKQYISRGEGTSAALIDGIATAVGELDDKMRAQLANLIINQMRQDEKLYALSPGAQVPATTSKRSPAQPRRQKPAADLTRPEPPPPPIY